MREPSNSTARTGGENRAREVTEQVGAHKLLGPNGFVPNRAERREAARAARRAATLPERPASP